MAKKQATEDRESKFYNEYPCEAIRKRIREELKITYTKASQMFSDAGIKNVSVEAVRQWCGGYSRPDMDKLPAISNVLGCSLNYLFGLDECANPDINAIRAKTGLTEDAITILCGVYAPDPERIMALNKVLVAREFYHFLAGIAACMKIGEQRSILERNIEEMYNDFLKIAQNKEQVSTLEEGKASRIKEERINIADLAIFKARNPIENLSIRIANEACEKNYGEEARNNGEEA